jgi:hypothetical protein
MVFAFAVFDWYDKEERLIHSRFRGKSVARFFQRAAFARAFRDVGHGFGLLCASRPDFELWHG